MIRSEVDAVESPRPVSLLIDLFAPPLPVASNNSGIDAPDISLVSESKVKETKKINCSLKSTPQVENVPRQIDHSPSDSDQTSEPKHVSQGNIQVSYTHNDPNASGLKGDTNKSSADLPQEDIPLLFGDSPMKSPNHSNGYQSFSAKNWYDSSDTSFDDTPTRCYKGNTTINDIQPLTPLPAIFEIPISGEHSNLSRKVTEVEHQNLDPMFQRCFNLRNVCSSFCTEVFEPSTFIGALMFLLFHNVYCLAMGAAIIRPHGMKSIVGPMTEMAALGIIMGSPIFWWKLRNDIPALYPSVDLFTAPFLANIAALVDEELFKDPNVSMEDTDAYFLTTFTFLASISLLISGILLILASVFKLANLGSYLPYPVLCGFFASVGVLTWSLAFKVDCDGKTVDEVFLSNDWILIKKSLIHHIPSICLGVLLKTLGPKHPFFVAGIICATIGFFYFIMFIFNISMADMVNDGWFWSGSDLHYETPNSIAGGWSISDPCGWIFGFINGKVHWNGVYKGLETSVALGVLYLIRCSLHAAALKKNVSNLVRQEKIVLNSEEELSELLLKESTNGTSNQHRRKFSESIDFDNSFSGQGGAQAESAAAQRQVTQLVGAKPTTASLKDILYPYGLNQCFGALIGSFGIVPSVSSTTTMYLLKAEKLPPQICSCLMLCGFYFTDFSLVGYIPKAAFSSMLVLAFLDLTDNWVIKSYFKTKEKMEWLVVPLIVVLAFAVGLLQSVFLGLAMSTFLFVGSFFKSGVVKHVSNGLKIRSTIERPMKVSRWLDDKADQIQILVLQNYLFFGNASSILCYITSMFDEAPADLDPRFIPPIPKIIILDLTLVTGMDTSAVDVFADILNRCKTNGCKLFLSGVSNDLRQVMALCGVKPDVTSDFSQRCLRFFNELDAAIGKAEDTLVDYGVIDDYPSLIRSGFRHALEVIDEEHETDFTKELLKLEAYTEIIEVEASEVLYRDQDMDRGLFFIEYGMIKIERNSDFTFARSIGSSGFHGFSQHGTLNATRFRTESIGREFARLKATGRQIQNQTFNSRLARVGPGWILGLVEVLSGCMNSGRTIAVTKCRLHYISYRTLSALESHEPMLILNLYKLLSYLMAKRQEMTIAQLGTLQSIMSSPAQKRPISRRDSGQTSMFDKSYR